MTCFSFSPIKVKSLCGLLHIYPLLEFIIQIVLLKVFMFAVQGLGISSVMLLFEIFGGTELEGVDNS